MVITEWIESHGSAISQESERLFVTEFLYPILGGNIEKIIPQKQFIDRTGKCRRIDFAYMGQQPIALEVDGESYHAEGMLPKEAFDDSLFRQNEILNSGYKLVRFSYSQLQSPYWRPIVMDTLRGIFADFAPELLNQYILKPTEVQGEALHALDFHRTRRGWKKGVIVMPTGTGKTILSALDAKRVGGRVLFIVHRIDILKQSVDAFKSAWGSVNAGFLTGEQKDNWHECDVLFASKDTLRQAGVLEKFERDFFDYIIVDEVHHGQCPSYRDVLAYFEPKFMHGLSR